MFGRLDAVGRIGVLHVTVRCDAFVVAVACLSALELVNVLADEVALDAVAGHERQRLLHDLQLPKARKLVQHHQEPVFVVRHRAAALEVQLVS